MGGYLIQFVFYAIPFSAILFFIASLCGYSDARKKYKAEPSEENTQNIKKSKSLVIVSSVILGVMLAVVIGFIALMYTAIAYM